MAVEVVVCVCVCLLRCTGCVRHGVRVRLGGVGSIRAIRVFVRPCVSWLAASSTGDAPDAGLEELDLDEAPRRVAGDGAEPGWLDHLRIVRDVRQQAGVGLEQGRRAHPRLEYRCAFDADYSEGRRAGRDTFYAICFDDDGDAGLGRVQGARRPQELLVCLL